MSHLSPPDDDAAPRTGSLPEAPGSVPPAGPRWTRRHVVHTGAVVGAAAWLGGLLPSAPAGAAGRRAVARSLTVRRADLAPGRILEPIAVAGRFDLAGATVAGREHAAMQIRARRSGGAWSPWRSLDAHGGHAPDGRRAAMGDPVWFGDADELQLRARQRPARDVRLDLIRIDAAVKRRSSQAAARARPQSGATRPGTATSRSGPPAIIPRSAWAAGLQPRSSPDRGQVQVAFVHHTVNGNAYSAEESPALVRAIAEYHMRSNGWNDIGYNFLVDRYGQIFEGRAGGIDQAIVGAQAVGWNSVSTGIAIIGDFMGTPAPDAALDAVAALIGWKLPLHGAPTAGSVALVSSGGSGNRWARGAQVDMARISGHQDGCSTDCPGKLLYGQLDAIRERVGSVQPTGSPGPSTETDLSIAASASAPAYGSSLVLSGRLMEYGSPNPGRAVVLEKQGPSGGWVPVARAFTGDDGRWSITIAWRAATPVRASSGAQTSKELHPGLNPGLVLDQPARRVRTGRSVTVKGRARGVAKVDLVLERQQGKRYERVARRTVDVRGGRFSGSLPVRVSAKHRVRVQATSGGRSYTSPRRYLRAAR